VPSPDATLSNLTVNPGTLQPTLSSNVTTYMVDVTTPTTSVTVTAQPQVAGATITINGQTMTSLSVTLGAAGSSTPIAIVVTAPSGSQNTYLVTVNRAALGGNNSLQSLTVSPGTLAPAFDANTLNYSVDAASGVGSVTVTATLQDTNASMTVNGQGTSSGQARTITLGGAGSSTPITIVVTAPNGTQKTYSVNVNRSGGNNNLQSLSVSPGPLSPAFSASTTSYTVDVGSGVNSVTVTATLQDTNASMLVNGQGTSSGQARTITPLSGPGLSTLITIVVTAPNGSQKTYFVTVNRAALASNAGLSNLAVNTGTLSPFFVAPGVSGLPGYTVAVLNATTSITVTAVTADPNATLTISPSATVNNLPLGNTVFTIEVTAPNGNQKTYFVTVNRAAPGTNADLSSLSVSTGALDSLFAAATLNYTVTATNMPVSTTVTATVADSNATLTINGSAATSAVPSAPISLVLGPNPPISIVVTAQDGTTSKTYTVTITVQ
jgi:hypothetical protein